MKIISIIVLSLVIVTVMAEKNNSGNTPQARKETYCNPRFGYCFTYDPSVFSRIPEGIDADGVTITDNTGTVSLETYGSFNPYELNINDLLEQNLEYLMRNEPSGPMTINEFRDATSYHISFETEDAYFKQELVLDRYFYKVLTVKVAHDKKHLLDKAMESTHFVPNATMAASSTPVSPRNI